MMLAQPSKLQTFFKKSATPTPGVLRSEKTFFKSIIESFLDGILILTEQGECIESNNLAQQICTQLTPNESPPQLVPKEIWTVCQPLLGSSRSYSKQAELIESEISTHQAITLRVRVQWLSLNALSRPCLLVILENRSQSLQNLAISEVNHYKLTPREAEVWLLSRANFTRQEIAAKLYISLNTVKKHLKNIQVKRKTEIRANVNSRQICYDRYSS